jgi:hypothetical protein
MLTPPPLTPGGRLAGVGIEEAPHTAFEQAIQDEAQDNIAEPWFERTRAQRRPVRADRAVLVAACDRSHDFLVSRQCRGELVRMARQAPRKNVRILKGQRTAPSERNVG